MNIKEGKENEIKLCYFGAGLSGRNTTLKYVYDSVEVEKRKGIERNYYEGYGHITSCKFIKDDNAKNKTFLVNLIATTGAFSLNAKISDLLKKIDGIIFVADSQYERLDANIATLYNVEQIIEGLGYNINKFPFVFQLNKIDLTDVVTQEEVIRVLNSYNKPIVKSVASFGLGVLETFSIVFDQILNLS